MARLAQSVERGTFNPEVKGSSPLSGGSFLNLEKRISAEPISIVPVEPFNILPVETCTLENIQAM